MNIRPKFIMLFLAIGLLPVVVVGVIAYSAMSAALRNSTVDQLSSTAVKQEQRITNLLQTKQEEVVKFANRYDLQLTLRSYVAQPNKANRDALAAILQSKKTEASSIESLQLTDTSGNIIASSAGTQVAIQAPETNDGIAVRKDPQDGFTKLYITTGVSINRQRAATVMAVFRTDDFTAVVQDYTGLGNTGETVVASKDGISLFPLRFDTDAAVKTNVSSLDMFNDQNTSYRELLDYRNESVIVVSHKLETADWAVATKIDTSEAYASIITLRNGLAAILTAVIVVIIIVTLFFTRLLTRPIIQLSEASKRIGRGDFMTRVPVTRRDEIGALANSINTMEQNLNEMVGSIESQRQRLQVILDSTTEGIFAIDDRGKIIIANSAATRLTQMKPEILVGQSMHDLFTWRQNQQSFLVDYDVGEVKVYRNLQYTDKKGIERYVKLIVAPVSDKVKRGSTRAIVTIHDETSSHELENMKTDFVSMAAHELRTPLTAVRGYLEVALYKNEHDAHEDVIPFVRQALKNVDVLGGLINNLLDVTRIEKGTLLLTMEKVDLAADVVQAVEALQFTAADKQLTLRYDGPKKGCFVVADQLALHEVTTNLLSNAVKYTREKGTIVVTLTQADNVYEVAVKDTGIGIPETALSHLFRKFYRVHGGLATSSSGTGLGLYIAKSILKRHNGTIRVESKEGVGSTFTFALPIFTQQLLDEMHPQSDEEPGVNIRRKRGWLTKNITR
ncbi:MAG TPA: ATP-binding protein [Candidatus Saccharimonadales bacterium]|nr:ATP-binding protein [Candidatus Saccharimonadales bacterium]